MVQRVLGKTKQQMAKAIQLNKITIINNSSNKTMWVVCMVGIKKQRHTWRRQKNKNKDDCCRRKLQYKVWKLHLLKSKARPEDESLFSHLKTFFESDTDILITSFKSPRQKAITNNVEQQKKIRTATTRCLITGWLRNKTVVHKLLYCKI